jgi:alcohol dehydrogenase
VTPNPDIDYLDKKRLSLKSNNYKSIFALGGGSVIDTAKALSAALSNNGENLFSNYFRDKKNFKFKKNVFLVVIPTTSGTGSEVTPFATIWDFKNKNKYSLDGDYLYPDIVLLEPELTLSLPFEETLFPGLDATSHALESIWNVNADKLSIEIAKESLRIILEAFPIVLLDPENLEAREKMQKSSLLSGIAISKTKTAIAHSISYPLTNRHSVPHGIACSFTLVSIIDDLFRRDVEEVKEIKEIIEVKEMLLKFNLKKYLYEYIDKKSILSAVKHMYSPERAKNFNQEINLQYIERIVLNSL